MLLSDVLVKPVLTEKASAIMSSACPVITFRIHPQAGKQLVRQAVEKILGAKVQSVRIMTCHGKRRRMGRFIGKTADWKKAIITLRQGEKMTGMENLLP